ncbi:MAG: 6-pyruvoyl-tetrahydropterin synthase-related protein, partial [Anaerolineae bacterium]|nr:6-pyruvoyl-tetrahydropterin synthase-related protein [Anaerolineae bacterium]
MRRRWWRASLPLLLACAIGLFASWPLLTNPGLPEGTDAELHIYRTAELGYSLRAGALYPRWAPDFYHGHGYPIFNYYAPLTYYLSYALSLGRPEAAEAGVKATLVVSQVLGAAGAYMLGRVFGRRGGGVLGALAYSLAPYVQLVNPHIRGAIAESVALGFLPWALWSWEMLWRRGRGAPVPAVLTTAAVFLSHNLTGLSCLALVGLLGVWRAVGKGRALLVVAAWTVAAFALLTAFFWVPFVLERSAVQLNVAGDGHYDFRNHFVALRQLFAWVGPMDRRAASAHVPMSAGPPVLL